MSVRLLGNNLLCLFAVLVFSGSALAGHAWSTYHWARTVTPFQLKVIDSVTDDWQAEFNTALDEWNAAADITLVVDSADDSGRVRKRCNAKNGQMRVCNAAYGFNKWLGLASIYIDNNSHIVKGVAKMNDSYASYWAIEGEKNHVMCQEIGHVLGLGHTSEDGSSQQTCMDYSSDINSQWPNAHDLEELAAIYGHLDSYDSYDTGSTTDSGGCTAPPGKGCNKNGAAEPVPVPMGVLVHRGEHHEIRVAPAKEGGLWIHHIRLVPEAYRD
ncbi:MAG: hypothetical protein OEX11_00380 [Nitrosomonas sp.]|nr:hypothetical protein [Nitrosomonas sp.]